MHAFSFFVAVVAPVSVLTGVVPDTAFSFFVAVVVPVLALTGDVPCTPSSHFPPFHSLLLSLLRFPH